MTEYTDKSGSNWRRWDPHIHGPGTILNDQYGGQVAWEEYLTRLEQSSPQIEAVGITDYYSLNVYEEVKSHKESGRLPNIKFIFPNVELRYGVGTAKASPINFHLLVSPHDPEHVGKTKRFLERLTYRHSNGDTYRCSQTDLIGLGKAHVGNEIEDHVALREGTNQFKVEVDQFLKEWADTPWIRENTLIAVAVGSTDGTSGLQKDASLSSLRQKIEAAAHIMFSSQLRQREFWLGRGVLPENEIKETYGSLKPCLHGSDAHDLAHVGEPTLERYCWIKGDPCFETLKQACLEPADRVSIGDQAPQGAYASQTIKSVSLDDAPWFKSESVELNRGLVGVIGPRGSGKSALADIIATGGYDMSSHLSSSSFVSRAKDLLSETKVSLAWNDDNITSNKFDEIMLEDVIFTPRVRYLSQQFVERMCSQTGAQTELTSEIERVIFEAHPKESRLETDSFQDFLSVTAKRGREERKRHEEALSGIGERIARERDIKDELPGNKQKLIEQEDLKTKLIAEREKLVPKEAEAHAKEFEAVSTAANSVRTKIEKAKRRMSALEVLSDHVQAYRDRFADDELASLKTKHKDTDLLDDDWAKFKKDFTGDVNSALANAKKVASDIIVALTGSSDEESAISADSPTFLPANTPWDGLPLLLLEKEEKRLRLLMGVDEEKRKKHEQLTERIRVSTQTIERLRTSIETGVKADTKISELNQLRSESYQGVFDGIIAEEEALRALYEPLCARLTAAQGALANLTFSIKRHVDLKAWAAKGEALIDKRKEGDFKGVGSIEAAARQLLLTPWKSGSAEEVAEAMLTFRTKYNKTIRDAANINTSNIPELRKWGARVSEWVYSTNHISVTYGLEYEGVSLETLSPGTRGIVLLLLYLAIDTDDDRPLIIDQPEENLDPQSIFDELVGLFREAKKRRQIIIVTHNANLIVNTDADQVIVAHCENLKQGQLPDISYTTGALENSEIRRQVCDILEGGEQAFLERAKRLRVTI